ncbi:MAG: hypothetical protein AB7U75_20075 [Hyphomicrobiaceae bacterium]
MALETAIIVDIRMLALDLRQVAHDMAIARGVRASSTPDGELVRNLPERVLAIP